MPLPTTVPIALTPGFAALKTATWAAFFRRNALEPVEMAVMLDAIRAFAWPVMGAAANAVAFTEHWTPAKGWYPHAVAEEQVRA